MTIKNWLLGCLRLNLVNCVAVVGVISWTTSKQAIAQITPDATLGTESSVVTPNLEIRGIPSDRIDGGAIRGANLFHSFGEFNIKEGRGAYFTNSQGIENILSRVTGNSRSEIFGRLGVLGSANLFFINPNGITFGQNASLDVEGSFVATTASAISLGEQGYFSATQPQQSNLLAVSPRALFFNQVAAQPGNIVNTGNLAAGKDLMLAGGNLDLQGQLSAGQNLTLQATDTVKIRDTVTSPFLGISGGNFAIVGNQGIDILALNHPKQIPVVSGRNLSLTSDGIISLDARVSSGGSFSIQSVSGGLANFVSLYDPIISTNGDVDVAANYTGASLLVEAKGNIRFQGDINITGPDTGELADGPDTTTLSTSSALILRSQQQELAYGGVDSGNVLTYSPGTVPHGITLGGNVTLQPFNGSGGIVNIEAASGDVKTQLITTNGQQQTPDPQLWDSLFSGQPDNNVVNPFLFYILLNGSVNNGGEINISAANGNIDTGNLYSFAFSLGAANAGGINISAGNGSISTGDLYSASVSSIQANAGGININAGNGSISIGDLYSATISSIPGNAGQVSLNASNGSIDTKNLYSVSFSLVGSGGNAGAVTMNAANNINITGNLLSRWSSISGSGGSGGDIKLEAKNNISTNNLNSTSYSQNGSAGNAGKIHLIASDGNISTGAVASDTNSEFGIGTGGVINLEARNGSISTNNLNASSYSRDGTAGDGGEIRVEAGKRIITNRLLSSSYSESGSAGNGGKISLVTSEGNIVTGSLFSRSDSLFGIGGNGGEITISTGNGNIFTGHMYAYSYAQSDTVGNGGDITISTLNGNISTESVSSDSHSGSGTAANGGSISISAANGGISTEYLLSDSYSDDGAEGKGGDINLKATNAIAIESINSTGGLGSGHITIKTQEAFTLDNGVISSDTFGSERGGDIQIIAPSISLKGGAQISASTHSSGQGGNIILAASKKVELIGAAIETPRGTYAAGLARIPDGTSNSNSNRVSDGTYLGGFIPTGTTQQVPDNSLFPSGVFTQTTDDSTGSAGNVRIETGQLIIEDQAAIATTTFGQDSNAGNILVKADSISVDNGSILSGVAGGAKGDSGTIELQTRSLSITGGGIVQTQTLGNGKAGNIQVTADAVSISGTGSGLRSGSGGSNELLGNTGSNIGQGGDINVTTNQLTIADGAVLDAQTQTDSQSGNITVKGNTLSLENGGQLLTSTSSNGEAGDITLNIPQIKLFGSTSGIFAQTTSGADAGDLTLQPGDTSQNLLINFQDGAQISAATSGKGKGGNLTVTAPESITVSGNGTLAVTAENNSSGDAGNINFTTQNLTFNDQVEISAATFSEGQGGNINVQSNSLTLNNSQMSASTQGQGNAGNITVKGNTLSLENGGQLLTSTSSNGEAGDITVSVPQIKLFGSTSGIFAQTTSGADAGDLTLQPGDTSQNLLINFQDGAQISAATSGKGKGGNLTVTAPESITVSGNGTLAVTAENNSSGDAGNINFTTQNLTFNDQVEISAATFSEGQGGNINVQSNSLTLNNSQMSASTQGQGNAGNITVKGNTLSLENGGQLLTSTSSNGEAGDITVSVPQIKLFGSTSGIFAQTTSAADAGDLTLEPGDTSQNLTINFQDGGQISAATSGSGKGGNLTVTAPESITVSGNGTLAVTAENNSSGDAGNINFTTQNLTFNDQVEISAATFSEGQGGNINVQSNSLTLNNSQISARAQGQGNAGSINIDVDGLFSATNSDIINAAEQSAGGAININAGDIRLFGDSDITTNVFNGTGGGGDINLSAGSIIAFDDSDILAFARDGRGGNINLNTPAFFGQNYTPASVGTDPSTLDGNDRVDINASGAVSGVITVPDVSFLQNSLTELPENLIDTSSLIANSCIARSSRRQEGTFIITGSGGLPSRPGDAFMSTYAMGSVRSIPNASLTINSTRRPWQKGDPIVEPQGAYQLPSGQLVLSRECSN
ncbi:filamentous hemagglutinin N-terminal domain-containing protein [Nostoc sp. UHCC 0702]|nr:filamentous hemagglutinin N-terminal domain-containing protein [Nostoc sp. UHCC 0702]